MGYKIKQLATIDGNTYAVLEMDAAADISALPDYTDGSVAYIVDDPDKMYLKISGAWALTSKTRLAPGPHIDLDGANPYMLMLMNLLFARRGEVAALLDPDKRQYYFKAALPTEQGTDAIGMIVFNYTDKSLNVCTTTAATEMDVLTVGTGAVTKAGTITVSLNGVGVEVEVEADDTAAEVADLIAETAFSGWNVQRGEGATVIFFKEASGECEAPAFDDTDGTGAAATFERKQQGVTGVWGSLINPAG